MVALVMELHAREAEHHGQENLVIYFGNHVTVRPTDRPSAPQAYQCKITQPTVWQPKCNLSFFWREIA